MSAGSSGEKTEKPTPKKRKEGRKEGQIARSADIGSWGAMLAASYLLPMTFSSSARLLEGLLLDVQRLMVDPDTTEITALLGQGMRGALGIVLLLSGVLLGIGLAASIAQVGWAPSGKLIKPQAKRLNPFKGLKKMASVQTLWEGAKSLAKVVVIGLAAYGPVVDLARSLSGVGRPSAMALALMIGESTLRVVRAASLAGLLLGVADYAFSRRRVGKQLKMSKQDIKDEYKQSEGDPQLKGQIRERQLRVSRSRMIADVAKADVVIVNPTHIALALVYDPARGAPRVVAKGAGAIAGGIRRRAEESGVPIVQDVPLARALYPVVDVDREVPVELYEAVARLLAFVYSLKARGLAGGHHRPPMPLLTAA